MRTATTIIHKGGLALVLVLLAIEPKATAAQQQRPTIDGIDIGFQGRYKVGMWTPMWITVTCGSDPFEGALVLQVGDGDEVGTYTYPTPVLLSPGQSQRFLVHAKPGQQSRATEALLFGGGVGAGGRPAGRLVARFNTDDVPNSNYEPLTHTDRLFVAIGGASLSDFILSETNQAQQQVQDQDRRVVSAVTGADQLPTRWFGYQGVDAVVLATADQDDLNLLDETRLTALQQWVRRGGRLIVSATANWDQLSAHPLAEMLPASFAPEGPAGLRQFSGLVAYAASNAPLVPAGTVDPIPMARLEKLKGPALAGEGRLPLIVRAPYGFGEVTLIAVDTDRAPFDRWPGRTPFWNKLLDVPKEDQSTLDDPPGGRLTYMALSDMASQLRNALETFEGVKLVSFGWVAFFIIIYIILIGPADYFFLKKVVKRLEWTWFTFPSLVIGVSVLAYVTAYWLKGSELRINQVEVVDIDASRPLVRGTTWFTVFSPRIDNYNLDVQSQLGTPIPAQAGTLVSWLGLPEDSFDGMYGSSRVSLFQRSYQFGPGAESLYAVPIQVWSTKSFTAQWEHQETGLIETFGPPEGGDAPGGGGRLAARGPNALVGALAHHLDRPLQNCILAFGAKAYSIKRLKPGEVLSLSGFVPENATAVATPESSRLTDALRGSLSQAEARANRWDRVKTNPDDVIPLMLFYESAEGHASTRLTNAYLSTMDWSRHLRTHRAVLLGKLADAPEAVSEIRRDGQPLRGRKKVHTYVRFLLPVNASDI